MIRKHSILAAGLSLIMVLAMLPVTSLGAKLPFEDVPANAWYYSDVQGAYETGLINGRSATTFAPEANMTYAEAVKLAACMHQKYTTGSVTLTNGSPNWGDSYVDYAKTSHIISKLYSWDSNATRAGYVEIFAHALPYAALAEKNAVPDGSIPDVTAGHPQAAEIYKLYRAGILTGMDEKGTFRPDSSIKRSEVSAILTRMMSESARKTVSLAPTGPTYAVRFNSNGGSPVAIQTVAEFGTAVKPANPVKEGVSFLGWYSDSKLTTAYDFNTPVIQNVMLYARWSDPESQPTGLFTVLFVTGSGAEPIPPQVVTGGRKVAQSADPERKGYLFSGWYTAGDTTTPYDFDSPVTENVTLFAKWNCTISDNWEQIIASVQNGTYRDKYQIGDTKSLDLGPEGVIEMQIAAFDADKRADGNGTAAITWIACQPLNTSRRMNPPAEVSTVAISSADGKPRFEGKLGTGRFGGWEYSELRAWLRDSLQSRIPDPVRSAILPVRKRSTSYNVDYRSEVTTTTDAVWVPSFWEMTGEKTDEGGGAVYTDLFATAGDRIKVKNESGVPTHWWLRSVSPGGNDSFFHGVTAGGILDTSIATFTYGVVIGFCI